MTAGSTSTNRLVREAGPIESLDGSRAFLRREAAARFLGLAPGTLANWASAGKGPGFHRVGRIPLYEVGELRRYVEARRVMTTEAA